MRGSGAGTGIDSLNDHDALSFGTAWQASLFPWPSPGDASGILAENGPTGRHQRLPVRDTGLSVADYAVERILVNSASYFVGR